MLILPFHKLILQYNYKLTGEQQQSIIVESTTELVPGSLSKDDSVDIQSAQVEGYSDDIYLS